MFDKSKHLTQKDAFFGHDLTNNCYVHLDLPTVKTAKHGKIQSIFLIMQQGLCPLEALENLASIVPATADDPLFSWHDSNGDVRPMVKAQAMECINSILSTGN